MVTSNSVMAVHVYHSQLSILYVRALWFFCFCIHIYTIACHNKMWKWFYKFNDLLIIK